MKADLCHATGGEASKQTARLVPHFLHSDKLGPATSSSASGWEGWGDEGVEGRGVCVWDGRGEGRGAKALRVTQMFIFPHVVETRCISILQSYVEFNVMRIIFFYHYYYFFFKFPHYENTLSSLI